MVSFVYNSIFSASPCTYKRYWFR